ncbi:MAG: plasmid mobilization relaxosome protein MobC [Phenylobacterium sp.]|nr:plasmid mobilization relaxosome protein MobC [Phenylobacterium sp.]
MALFNVRLPDELALRFDAWAGTHGGRSASLRRLIAEASMGDPPPPASPSGPRPTKLTVRLAAADARGLDVAASSMGLSRNGWAAAVIRRRLVGRPTFRRSEELALLAIQSEVHRIGINVNQIARALNTAVMDGKVLDLEVAALADLRTELRAHIRALREAFEGNLAYWQVDL